MKVAQFDKAEELFQMILDQATDEKTRAEINHNLVWSSASREVCKCDQGKSLRIKMRFLLWHSYGEVNWASTWIPSVDKKRLFLQIILIWLLLTTTSESVYDKHGRVLESTFILWKSSWNQTKNSSCKSSWFGYFLQQHRIQCMTTWASTRKHFHIMKKHLKSSKNSSCKSSWFGYFLQQHRRGVWQHGRVLESTFILWKSTWNLSKKTLPANHPHLATSYNNIGGVYDNMGEYSKALSYYEKALEICQKTLPANHPDLATSYNNIGLVYKNMGEYSKALSYYEKALKSNKKLFLQIILIWLLLTTTSEMVYDKAWASTRKHFHIWSVLWVFGNVHYLLIILILKWWRTILK